MHNSVMTAVHAKDPLQQQNAMAFLHDLEQTDGISLALMEVVQNNKNSFSEDSRLLSIIYLKNIVSRRWIQVSNQSPSPIHTQSILS